MVSLVPLLVSAIAVCTLKCVLNKGSFNYTKSESQFNIALCVNFRTTPSYYSPLGYFYGFRT